MIVLWIIFWQNIFLMFFVQMWLCVLICWYKWNIAAVKSILDLHDDSWNPLLAFLPVIYSLFIYLNLRPGGRKWGNVRNPTWTQQTSANKKQLHELLSGNSARSEASPSSPFTAPHSVHSPCLPWCTAVAPPVWQVGPPELEGSGGRWGPTEHRLLLSETSCPVTVAKPRGRLCLCTQHYQRAEEQQLRCKHAGPRREEPILSDS